MNWWIAATAAVSMCLAAGCKSEEAPEGAATPAAAAPGSQPKAAAPGSQPKAAAPGSQPKAAAPGSQPKAAARSGVDFAWPQTGSKVFASTAVAFTVQGMTVTPAGEHIQDQSRGHHHLIIDGQPIAKGTVVPKDATHIHFGGGQTQTQVKLEPGERTLTMQFADGAHISYGPALAKTLKLTVVPDPAEPPKVSFVSPADGATVKSPVKVTMGLTGLTLQPAGEAPNDKTTGHHHIVVDGAPIPLGQVVPADATHIHFGKAQTEATLTLTPGPHTLTLQVADGAHRSYGTALSAAIKITVE
jgi:hypothetical protein